MEILELTRKIGAAIQSDERYKKYVEAQAACDNDKMLQEVIGKFNLERINLDNELAKEDKDQAKIGELNNVLRNTYGEVMMNPSMVEYNTAKGELDAIMNEINGILSCCLNGEDPETCEPPQAHSHDDCGGSCSSCSGCH